jgi:transcription antitermination factor NusG
MIDQPKQKNWFALYLKPQHEFKAKVELEKLSIQNYLPIVTKLKQWSDRKKKIDEPLLKGYIFIFADEKERLNSLENRCVVKCVSDHGRPAKIPEWQITNLKNMLSNEGDFMVLEELVKGSSVEIVEGPFKGVQGVVQQTETHNQLAVTNELLNRSVMVHLPQESVTRDLSS